MTRYADPHRCPDCRSAISPGDPACGRCGLSLRGEAAAQLYGTLTRADELLSVLRAGSVPAGRPEGRGAEGALGRPLSPTTARGEAPTRRRGLRLTSVPQILLALGAGCLLVAALVFLAVTWSVLGVGGRTATLLILIVVAGGCATVSARRGLRGATEALALVGYGLLTLDVLGAERAGWFGDLLAPGLLVLLGCALLGSGVMGAVAARRTPLADLTCAQVVAVVGTALVCLGVATDDQRPVAISLVLATVSGVAVTGLGHRLHLRAARGGAGVVTAVAWLSLTGYALFRTSEHNSWRELWAAGEVWPLLVAAALVASPALLRRAPVLLRVGALALAHLLVVTAVLAPTATQGATTVVLVALGVLVLAAAATLAMPRPWHLVNAATQVVAGAWVLLVGGLLAVEAAVRLLDAADPAWSGSAGDRLPLGTDAGWTGWADQPAPWLLPLIVLAVVGTVAVLARTTPRLGDLVAVLADLRLGAAVVAGSVVAAVALYPVTVWLVLGLLLVVASAFTLWWLLGDPAAGSELPLAPAAVFLGTAVVVSLHADLLGAFVLSAAVAFCATVLLCDRTDLVASAAGGSLAAAVAGAAWSWTAVAGAGPQWGALVGLLVLGGLVLLAPYGSQRWATTLGALPRIGVEAGTVFSAVALLAAGVRGAPVEQDASWTAVYLTVCGAAVTVLALLQRDRRPVAWAGGALLAAATWVRLGDLGVTAPEAYTLPTAAVLVLVGLSRLRTDRSATTMRTLAPGLSLMLVPSLLWVLADPTGPRTLLLGLGCLVLVLTGARLGWTAPVALGAAVGALVVLRLASPYVGDAVPRWVLLGAAGALLITVGATWERRLAEANAVVGYLRNLR